MTAAPPPLRLLDRVQLELWDFGWLDGRLFAAPDPAWRRAGPRAALAAVLNDPAYARTYCEEFPGERVAPGVHGPYRLDRISAADFIPIPPGRLAAEVSAILADAEIGGEYDGPPDAEQVAAVMRKVRPAPRHAHGFRLAADFHDDRLLALPEFRVHDFFEELVVLDGAAGTVRLWTFGAD